MSAVPSPAEDRRADVRRMIADRGWTEELTRIASMRVALALQAEGMPVPEPVEV